MEAPSPHLLQVLPTEKGVNLVFIGFTAQDAGNILGDFFRLNGFSLKSGSSITGTYEKGSAGARVALGGFVDRKKYNVSVYSDADQTFAQVFSDMSGMSGSWLGVVRERKGRDEIKSLLQIFLQQFMKR